MGLLKRSIISKGNASLTVSTVVGAAKKLFLLLFAAFVEARK